MKYATEEAFVGANAFGKGAANTAYAQYFVGNSYLNPLTDSQVTALHLSNVPFEPRCRNKLQQPPIHNQNARTPLHSSKPCGGVLHLYAVIGWWRGCRRWEPW